MANKTKGPRGFTRKAAGMPRAGNDNPGGKVRTWGLEPWASNSIGVVSSTGKPDSKVGKIGSGVGRPANQARRTRDKKK